MKFKNDEQRAAAMIRLKGGQRVSKNRPGALVIEQPEVQNVDYSYEPEKIEVIPPAEQKSDIPVADVSWRGRLKNSLSRPESKYERAMRLGKPVRDQWEREQRERAKAAAKLEAIRNRASAQSEREAERVYRKYAGKESIEGLVPISTSGYEGSEFIYDTRKVRLEPVWLRSAFDRATKRRVPGKKFIVWYADKKGKPRLSEKYTDARQAFKVSDRLMMTGRAISSRVYEIDKNMSRGQFYRFPIGR